MKDFIELEVYQIKSSADFFNWFIVSFIKGHFNIRRLAFYIILMHMMTDSLNQNESLILWYDPSTRSMVKLLIFS